MDISDLSISESNMPLEPKTSHKLEEQIPKELWLKILRYLPYKHILNIISFVSRFFNHLTKDSYLIKELKFGIITKHDFPFVQDVIKRSKGLVKVEFNGFMNAKFLKLVYSLLENNKNMKELIFRHNFYNKIDTSIIAKLGEKIEKLQILGQSDYLTGEHFAKMPNLKVLKTDLKCPDALSNFAKGSEKLQQCVICRM